jgi:hypothetical protein
MVPPAVLLVGTYADKDERVSRTCLKYLEGPNHELPLPDHLFRVPAGVSRRV